jgi:hypothetical protein
MDLKQTLCRRFCSYYKPSKREELACRGFRVVECLIRNGNEISFERAGKALGIDTADALEEALCRRCPFFADDCDFAVNKKAQPCGGYLLIGQLIESRTVSLDDLRDMD